MKLAYIKVGDKDTASMGWAISKRTADPPAEREVVVENLPFRNNPLYFPDLGYYYERREMEYEFTRVFPNNAKAQRGAEELQAWLMSLRLVILEDSIGSCKYLDAKCTSCPKEVDDNRATVTATFVANPYRTVNGVSTL